jgi:lipoate-protein ligase A
VKTFARLLLWIDPVARPGPEAMAVDEWLLESSSTPVLRVYGWDGAWASIGYFGNLAEAQAALPGPSWVRRWTGGGVVDHRADWTYTVVAPVTEPLARSRGAASYQLLHQALEEALRADGLRARLSTGLEQTGAALCFENPVPHDLVGGDGRKIAGAGQRRSRQGLLHQGSVAAATDPAASRQRAESLAACLADTWEHCSLAPPADLISSKVASRYASPAWTQRR